LVICSWAIATRCGLSAALPQGNKSALTKSVGSQPISGNGGHDNYGRGEKVSERKVNKIGVL
jgi:hypothetical protein